MKSLLVLTCLLGALASCSETHDTVHVEVQSRDCVICHLADYQNVTVVDHVAFSFPQTCADCHLAPPQQPTWNVVETNVTTHACDVPCRRHTETKFSITMGPHVVPTSLACIDCHAFTPLPPLPLADGTNAEDTNCITCHDRTMGTAGLGMMDQTHLSCGPPDCPVAGYTWSSTQTNFCLKCHPAGLL